MLYWNASFCNYLHFIDRYYLNFLKKYNYRNLFVSAKCLHFGEDHIFQLQNLLAQSAPLSSLTDSVSWYRRVNADTFAHAKFSEILFSPQTSQQSLRPPKSYFISRKYYSYPISSNTFYLPNLDSYGIPLPIPNL